MKLSSAVAIGAVIVAIGTTATAATAMPVRTAVTFGVTPGAYAYDLTYVPSGARATAHAVATGDGRTIVTLQVFGLLPDREYGAHAHVAACGPLPGDAGGHFQYVPGLANDPAFANPSNEIWLDVHTDSEGNGSSKAVLDWQFPADRRAHSIVIHDHHTSSDPGTAGMAGPRYGCLTVAF
jgi:Cu-Zn family superoxide dismutase